VYLTVISAYNSYKILKLSAIHYQYRAIAMKILSTALDVSKTAFIKVTPFPNSASSRVVID